MLYSINIIVVGVLGYKLTLIICKSLVNWTHIKEQRNNKRLFLLACHWMIVCLNTSNLLNISVLNLIILQIWLWWILLRLPLLLKISFIINNIPWSLLYIIFALKEASTLRWGKYERGEKKNSRIIDSAKLAGVGFFFFPDLWERKKGWMWNLKTPLAN